MCAIAAALVLAQTVLSEPAMQHVGIDAMFTRCGGNRCAGLLARGDQFSLELRAVDAALARATVVRIGSFLRHGVHDGLRGHDGACNGSSRVDGFAGRIQPNSTKRGTDCTSTDGLFAHGAAPDTNRPAGLHSSVVAPIRPTSSAPSLPAVGLTCSMHLRFHVWQGKSLSWRTLRCCPATLALAS